LRTKLLTAPLNWLCCLAALAASVDCGAKLSWSNVGEVATTGGAAGAMVDADGAASDGAGATGGAAVTTGAAGRADAGGATGGSAGDQTGVAGAQIEYAGTIVSPMSSGNEILFRRIDASSGVCVLVDVFVVNGQVSGPRTAYALQTDKAGCLTATTANLVTAIGSTGAISSADQGAHFYINLGLAFPSGMEWLAPNIFFKVASLPVDGAWHPEPS
jgi:hypothetical protein